VRDAHSAWAPPTAAGARDARGTGLERAVRFAQRELAPFCEANPGYSPMLEDALMVLTVDPRAAPAPPGGEGGAGARSAAVGRGMLLPARRMELWLEVNAAVLRAAGFDPRSAFEKVGALARWAEREFGVRRPWADAEEARDVALAEALLGLGPGSDPDWWRADASGAGGAGGEGGLDAGLVARGLAAFHAAHARVDAALDESVRAAAAERAGAAEGADEVLADAGGRG
jgi:hypothetical protein